MENESKTGFDKLPTEEATVVDPISENELMKAGMELVNTMIETNATTERYKADSQKEVALKQQELAEKRLASNEKKYKLDLLIGGLLLIVTLGAIVFLSSSKSLNNELSMILGGSFVAALSKIGIKFMKPGDKDK